VRSAFLVNFLPAPPFNGPAIRAHNIALALAGLGPVSLYCRSPAVYARRYANREELRIYERVHVERLEGSLVADDLLFSTWPHDCEAGRRLMEDHARDPFDLVVATQLYTVEWAARLPGVRVILDEHNIESRFAVAAGGLGKAIHAEMEHRLWPIPDLVTCVSEEDADHVRSYRRGPVVTVPNGTSSGQIPFVPPSQRGGDDILFAGTYLWPPNVAAAELLAREVLPRVERDVPSARLVLCGQPSSGVAQLRRANVRMTGTVESMLPSLASSAVYANALSSGAGTSLKTLEALASGMPLVATTVGVRGLPLIPDEHYLLADSPASFAEAIVAVLTDRARYDSMARRGRLLAEQYDWTHSRARFSAALAV
jgi:glycosyltransferase involved in cell wall biosynthesis